MSRKFRSISIAVILAPLPMSACGWLRPGGPPDEAVIELSSTDVDKATLVVSREFVWTEDPECTQPDGCDLVLQVYAADTTDVDLPFTETVKFTSTQQLFCETYPTEEVEARMGMRVVIDGDEKFNGFRTLGVGGEDGPRETLRYVYQFGPRPLDPGLGGDG